MRKCCDILSLLILAIMAPIQVYLAYLGIMFYLGQSLSIVILAISLAMQFPIPVLIGAFLGAFKVFGLHWALSLLVVMPGVVFMSPHLVKDAIHRIRKPSSAASA